MKNLMILLAILATGLLASATSSDRTSVVAIVKGSEAGIHQVSLLKDGRLQIKTQDGKTKQLQLSKEATANLINSVQALSNVEVKEDKRRVVCALKPRPQLSNLEISSYDVNKDEYSKDMKLVITSNHCASSVVVSPVQMYSVFDAIELRKALVILALNTVK